MPLSTTMALQSLPLSSMMAPENFFDPGSNMGSNAPFCNPYGLVNSSMGASASFGSLYWPAVIPSLPTETSYSSVASEQPIKIEDEPQVQPPQFDHDNTGFGSPSTYSNTSESSDETKPTVFNTDIDTLMRAIQSKHSPERQRQQLNSPDSTSSSNVASSHRSRSKKQHKCTIPGCDKAFRQKNSPRHPRARPHRHQALLLQRTRLRPTLQSTREPKNTPTAAHRRETLSLRHLRQNLRPTRKRAGPQSRPHGCETLHLQAGRVWEAFHSAG